MPKYFSSAECGGVLCGNAFARRDQASVWHGQPLRMGANAAAAAVQYPLDMGRKGDRGGNGTVALAMDASGNIK